MKRSVFCFVIIAAALIALVVWRGKRPAGTPPVPATETNPGAPASAERTAPTPIHQASAPIPAQTTAERAKQGLAALNSGDVVLYGKVVDQFAAPVTGAAVAGSVQVNNGTRVGVDRVLQTTDVNGLFAITGYAGKALGINVSKPGYVMATTNTRFVYSLLWPEAERHVADPSNPVVFKMWKLQGAEPLVTIDQRYKLPYTDAPITFDLLAGKVVQTGGDLKITVSRSPGTLSERSREDWAVRLEAIHGGLMDSLGQDAVTYQAHEEGYQQSASFIFSTNAPYRWASSFTEGFFLKSRDGQVYSKLGLSFVINEKAGDLMYIGLAGVANTNSSRNWEAATPQRQ